MILQAESTKAPRFFGRPSAIGLLQGDEEGEFTEVLGKVCDSNTRIENI
jgi:hypothetical protein